MARMVWYKNQEQNKDKQATAGINAEVIKLDFNQLKDGLKCARFLDHELRTTKIKTL